jgi:hypothetical protein
MVPAKTFDKVGTSQIVACNRQHNPSGDYCLTGNDLNDLAILAVRLNSRMEDGDELRDWQNRINLMLANAIFLP